MSFQCRACERKVSNSEMLGLAIGHCGRTVLEKKMGESAFSREQFTSGLLNGFKVPCPSCGKSDWKTSN